MKRTIMCLATMAAVSGLPIATSVASAATPLCPVAEAGYAASAPVLGAAKPLIQAAKDGGAEPATAAFNSGLTAFDAALCGPRA